MGEAPPVAAVVAAVAGASNPRVFRHVERLTISALNWMQRPPRIRDVQGKLFTLAVQGFGRFDGGV